MSTPPFPQAMQGIRAIRHPEPQTTSPGDGPVPSGQPRNNWLGKMAAPDLCLVHAYVPDLHLVYFSMNFCTL